MLYLDHFSFDVVAADDCRTAVEHLLAQPVAAILMEGDLAGDSERERLGAESRARGVPMILLVDTAAQATAAGLAELDAAAVLVKPFPLSEMLDTIRAVIRARMTATIN